MGRPNDRSDEGEPAMKNDGYDCQECGQRTESPGEYHPFLYCELYKLGHRDQEAYLRAYGFERSESRV